MSISMYKASIPNFVRGLNNLSAILDKAAAYAEAKKIEPGVLVSARLAPDMFPLSRQIQIASDAAKGCVARLAGIEVPSFPDEEKTLAELKERINKTIKFVQSVKESQVDGSEERAIVIKTPNRELNFKGLDYLTGFALPNFYFHSTVAYSILRHNGLDLGKMDFLGK